MNPNRIVEQGDLTDDYRYQIVEINQGGNLYSYLPEVICPGQTQPAIIIAEECEMVEEAKAALPEIEAEARQLCGQGVQQ